MTMNCGIYKITNRANGKFYIGSSARIDRRFYLHKWDLRRGSHHSVTLQRSWDKYGEDSFDFSVVAYCDSALLEFFEQRFIDSLKPYEPKIGYNIARHVENPMRGRKHTPEARKRASDIRMGKPVFRDNPVAMANLMATIKRGSDHHMFGKKHTPEARKAMSEKLKGRTSWNKGKPSVLKGVPRDPAVIEKIKATKRASVPSYAKLTAEQVVEIKAQLAAGRRSMKSIGADFGVSYSAIYEIAKGNNWSHIT